jgi:hypothetical protein|eukprot:COSAG01_NODE_7955_length_2976_cov_121.760514_2_plen_54_part_00
MGCVGAVHLRGRVHKERILHFIFTGEDAEMSLHEETASKWLSLLSIREREVLL